MITTIILIAITSSAYYMLIALGLSLAFGLLRIINFAHGEIVMLGAYTIYVLVVLLDINYFIALPIAGLITAMFGLVLEKFIFRPFLKDELAAMIVAIALAILIQGAVTIVFSVDGYSIPRAISGIYRVGNMIIPKDQMFVSAMALFLIIALHLILNRTRLGLMMRAVTQEPSVAAIFGIRSNVILPLGFAMACFIAGMAGALAASLYTVEPYMGESALLKSFIIIVIGGLGSLRGAVVGAFIMGILETLISVQFGVTVSNLALFVVMIILLTIFPAGIFGRTARR